MTDQPSDLVFLLKAAHFAADKHRHQRRKGFGFIPYINHPIEVVDMLARVGGVTDVEVLAAGMLHDTIEDTDTTREDLQRSFGDRVAALVMECTDDKSLPREERKRLQIESAPYKSNEAKQIKIADKTSNVQDLGTHPPTGWSLERKLEYLDWSEKVMAGLRGANASLEKLYDQCLVEARRQVVSAESD